MIQFNRALIVVLGGVAAASCGSEGQQAGNEPAATNQRSAVAAEGTDPCTLVTTEEMAAIIGEPIVSKAASEGRCEFQTADAMASSVTIELDQSDAAEAMDVARKAAGVLKDAGGAVAGQGGAGADVNAALSESGDAPKLGDEAFFGPNQQLSVRKGDSYIAISPPMMRSRMSGGNPLLSADDKKAMAMAVAEKAVARLP